MKKDNEKVIVLDRSEVFSDGHWVGINKKKFGEVVGLIETKGHQRRRGDVEDDPSVKQIGTYLIFRYQDRYLLMQRRGSHSDQRLASRYSLGIGGHLRKEDLDAGGVESWFKREFDEEVSYKGDLETQVIGAIYDNSNQVGRVHLGIVLLADGDSPDIQLKNEHISGELLTKKEIGKYYPLMENWSKMVLDYLSES